MGLEDDLMYLKLAAQICSSCFSTFVGTQHLLQMVGYRHPKRMPPLRQRAATNLPSATRPISTTTSSTNNSTNRANIDLLEAPPPPQRERASPATRILRAACASDLVFSLTGAISTAFIIHDPSYMASFQLTFWARGPHWSTQMASFCWMGTLAIYIAKRNRSRFDVAIAHAVIWLAAVFFWVLVLYASYYNQDGYGQAAMVIWMVMAILNILVVVGCWGIFVLRWKNQTTRRRGSYVVAKLLSYAIAFCVFVLPLIVYNIIQFRNVPGATQTLLSSLIALWPTANAIVFITRPVLCLQLFRDGDVTNNGGGRLGSMEAGVAGRGAGGDSTRGDAGMHYNQHLPTGRGMAPILMSLTQHELKGLEVGDKIGEGMAVVYKGKWRGADVAVKMKSLMIDRSEDLQEFQDACNLEIQQEAEVMKRLCHPNIVLFMEAGFYKGSICIISEYCARGSLRDVLMRSNIKHLSWSTKLRLALGIAHGIQYLHNANPPMIHRDLKSPNVLVDDSWHAKIADFGTLRFAEIVSSVQHTQSKIHSKEDLANAMVMTGLVGTTRWMAPEVIRGEKFYTHKVDIYSLGLILWELIEGKLPFESTRWNHEIEDFVLKGMRPVLRSDLCPLRWKLLIVSCWQSDPSQRPTIQQVIASMQRIAREETLDTTAPRFTGMSSMSSMTQSMASNMSFLNASQASMLSSFTSSNGSPTSMAQSRQIKRAQRLQNSRLFDESYVSVAESELELEDEDAAGASEFYVETGNFLREPTANLADSRIDEVPSDATVPSLPPRLRREVSGDPDAMISI